MGQADWVDGCATLDGRGGRRQSLLALQNRPGERRRIAAVDHERIEAVGPQMLRQPAGPSILSDFRALLDPPTIQDHDRNDEAAVLGPPPTVRPVAAALLLEGPVAQERDQALAGKRHVHVLDLGETKIAALRQRAARVGCQVTAERSKRPARRVELIAVEIRAEA